jgi:cytoskeletal protein CcmA (bactofilin family)
MEQPNRPDLSINGLGNAAGGAYRNVLIEGVGKVDGNLTCEYFKAAGVTTIKGNVHAQRFEVEGRMNGEGGVESGKIMIKGEVRLKGSLHGDDLQLEGLMRLQGDCEAERFIASGGFTIDGLLNAGTIEMGLHARTKVKEIGGESIIVKKSDRKSWSRLFKWMIPAFDPHLTADMIEGDDIHLEETTAGIVRGDRVVIGSGCNIKRVEYRSELIVHPEAAVTERIKG